jgi:uncharacterized protein YebE (UPF0316 family)
MNLTELFNGNIIGLVLIFVARICDVSIGTIRIILISRGYRYLAPVFGFFEVLIWLTAITHVLKNLNHISSYLVYAGGFAAGNYIGMILESKIAIGYQLIRIITNEKMQLLPMMLRDQGFGVTAIKGWGAKGEITMIYTVVPRKKVGEVMNTVTILEPIAFITIEDVKTKYAGFFIKDKKFTGIFSRFKRKKM